MSRHGTPYIPLKTANQLMRYSADHTCRRFDSDEPISANPLSLSNLRQSFLWLRF